MARIGIVKYINALPFRFPMQIGELQTEHTFAYDIPSRLNTQMRERNLDIALTSSSEYLSGAYQFLPGYCIAARQEILSVNLYLKGELNGGKIGLTHHSATSVTLLRVLCHHFWKKTPYFVPLSDREEYDGFLLIGDYALKKMTISGYRTIDLASAWYEATGLPFVFAVIAVRQGVQWDDNIFERALQWSEANRTQLIEAAYTQSGLPKSLINRYYDMCYYRLGKKELEGLQTFKNLSERVPKI